MLSQVLQYVERGWPSTCDKSLSTYSAKQSELSMFQGLCDVGFKGSHSTPRTIHCAAGASQGASRYDEDEGTSKDVCLVASN